MFFPCPFAGRKVMDASYLQQELGLEDSYRIFINSGSHLLFSSAYSFPQLLTFP